MKKTTDALEIINNLIGQDTQMQQMVIESYLNAEVGQLIYDARNQVGLTQQQLAEMIGVERSIIDDLEAGDYEDNALIMLQKVTVVFKQRIKIELISDYSDRAIKTTA